MNFLYQSLLGWLQKLRMVKNFATDPKTFFYILSKNSLHARSFTEEYFEHAEYE